MYAYVVPFTWNSLPSSPLGKILLSLKVLAGLCSCFLGMSEAFPDECIRWHWAFKTELT